MNVAKSEAVVAVVDDDPGLLEECPHPLPL